MDFEFTKMNQLNILNALCIKDEHDSCPSCGSKVYSSTYMEKASNKTPIPNTVSFDTEGVPSVFYMKCDCGHSWLEKPFQDHRRWRIKGVPMKSFGAK